MKSFTPKIFPLAPALLLAANTVALCAALTAAPAKPNLSPTATSNSRPALSASEKKQVKSALQVLAEGGEDIYDMTKAGSWAKAKSSLAALSRASRSMPVRWRVVGDLVRLDTSVSRLRQAIDEHAKFRAMHEANRVTLFTARLERAFAPKIPTEIALLDVYGRDLESGALSKDTVQIAQAVRDLSASWKQVRPRVLSRGGSRQARAFDALMQRTRAAGSPAQALQVATPILDQVDNLEGVFS